MGTLFCFVGGEGVTPNANIQYRAARGSRRMRSTARLKRVGHTHSTGTAQTEHSRAQQSTKHKVQSTDIVRRRDRETERYRNITAMAPTRYRRVRFATPLMVGVVLCCAALSGTTHAFAFTSNVNNNVRSSGERERGLHRRFCSAADSSSGRSSSSNSSRIRSGSSGVALLQRARKDQATVLSAGAGSKWSWSHATATALAALQVRV